MTIYRNSAVDGEAVRKLTVWTSGEIKDLAASPTITSGTGAPSAAEADGSVYKRTNGATYTRVGGAWVLDVVSGASTSSDATGISATGASTASGVALVTEVYNPIQEAGFVNMPAAAVNIIAQIASDIDESTWANITQVGTYRTLQIDASALWDGGDIGVTALWSDGTMEEKTLTATAGSIVESDLGVAPFSITRVRNLGTFSAGTCDVQSGPKPAIQTNGMAVSLVAFIEESTNGLDAAATIGATTGVISNTDAPNGVLDFRAYYKTINAYLDAGHDHVSGAISIVDAGHNHTV